MPRDLDQWPDRKPSRLCVTDPEKWLRDWAYLPVEERLPYPSEIAEMNGAVISPVSIIRLAGLEHLEDTTEIANRIVDTSLMVYRKRIQIECCSLIGTRREQEGPNAA